MIVGIDMDGCLVDFVGTALPRVKYLWNVDIAYEELTEPKIERMINKRLAFSVSGTALCTALFQPGFFASMLPRAGAVEALRTLVAQGHTLVIITRAHLQSGHIVSEKAEWLANHLQGIDYSTIIVGQGCTKDLINVDILVDDEPGNLEHPTAVSVCVVHPWNAEYLASDDRKRIVHKLYSMADLPRMVDFVIKCGPPGTAIPLGETAIWRETLDKETK